jgi:hypothetical protein
MKMRDDLIQEVSALQHELELEKYRIRDLELLLNKETLRFSELQKRNKHQEECLIRFRKNVSDDEKIIQTIQNQRDNLKRDSLTEKTSTDSRIYALETESNTWEELYCTAQAKIEIIDSWLNEGFPGQQERLLSQLLNSSIE